MSKKVAQHAPWEGPKESPKYQRCYETHPPLPVAGKLIYGGSCSNPVVLDADIYVGLDLSIKRSTKMYPWEQGESFLFHIQDMQAPSDIANFTKMIDWLAVQLIADKKVHIGCIGGHGRTGTVLSALVKVMTGDVNAIQYVRDHYCKKAVESSSQIAFLEKHFGITHVEPTKEGYSFGTSTQGSRTERFNAKYAGKSNIPKAGHGQQKVLPFTKNRDSVEQDIVLDVEPASHPISMWGSNVIFDDLK